MTKPLLASKLSAMLGGNNILSHENTTLPTLEGYYKDWLGWHSPHITPESTIIATPETTEHTAELLHYLHENNIRAVIQGGNTGLVRGGIPHDTNNTIIISTKKLTRINSNSAETRDYGTITVEAGTTLHQLDVAGQPYNMESGIRIASRGTATIGGAVATNAGGLRVIRWGRMKNHVHSLKTVFADGTIETFNSDNLQNMICGSEGTIALITEATIQLRPKPTLSTTLLTEFTTYEDTHTFITHATKTLQNSLTSCEFMTAEGLLALNALFDMRLPSPSPKNKQHAVWLLLEFSTETPDETDAKLTTLLNNFNNECYIGTTTKEQEEMWNYRERHPEIITHFGGETLKMDVEVPTKNWVQLAETLTRHLPEFTTPHQPGFILFGHAALGNIHVNVACRNTQTLTEATQWITSTVKTLDGTPAAEHGWGALKKPWKKDFVNPKTLLWEQSTIDLFNPKHSLNPHLSTPDW